MDAARLNPEIRKAFRNIPNPPVTTGFGRALVRTGLKLVQAPKLPDGMTREIITLPNGLPIRVFTPGGGGTGAALLNIHGGGMVIGAAIQDDASVIQTAHELNIVVFSGEYRLSPEHPFPAPLDDCHVAWEWVQSNAVARGVDPDRIAIGGQSAGGGLAAGLVLRLHDEGGTQPVAQWLFCPMLDDRTAANRELDNVKHYLWNNRSNLAGWRSYLNGTPGQLTVSEYAAPARRADLTGLPPTWIGAGDIELFYDEDRAYAAALTAAGVDTTLDVVSGAPHGFEAVVGSSQLAKAYTSRARVWLGRHLH